MKNHFSLALGAAMLGAFALVHPRVGIHEAPAGREGQPEQDPDIIVDNMPHATFAGGDAQLDAAIKYLQEQIRLHPIPVPAAPRYPDKSFKPRGIRGSQPGGADRNQQP